MSRHPSRAVLRRLQDEPDAVSERDRTHAASCPTCRHRSEALAANALVAGQLLGGVGPAPVDPLPALRQLRSTETSVVPPRPGALERLRSRAVMARRRTLRVGALCGVIALTMGTLVASGAAGSLIKIFQPDTFVPVSLDLTSFGSLPDLSGFGTMSVLQAPTVTTTATQAAAASLSGLQLLTPGKLPSEVKGTSSYVVVTPGSGSFTFSAATASGTAGKLGQALPSLPPGLNGSTLTLRGGPVVVELAGSQGGLGLLGSSLGSGAPSPLAGSHPALHGLLGSPGGLPQVAIVQMKAPVLYSDGPSVAQYEDALLSMPGVPASLASQIKALGNLSSTMPIPVPTSFAASSTADINGSPGLVIGDTTGIASAVIWQSHGLLYGVVGSLTDQQVVAIARSMH